MKFDQAADSFDTADYLFAATREGLMARLEPMTVDANIVLDLGSATGSAVRPLAKRFRGARVVAVDRSRPMLDKARAKKAWLAKVGYVQANARALPFGDHSIDVVFSNLMLPFVAEPPAIFSEVGRVLRKDGLFVFATLGPDSIRELRDEPFADMHNVGDGLVRAGLRDPVLDVDRLTVSYESGEALRRDFAAIGASACLAPEVAVSTLDFELVYGHCWGAGQRPGSGEFRVDPGQIGRRER